MRWRALALLLLSGCASTWHPPTDEPIRAGDTRVCEPANECIDLALVVDTSGSAALPIDRAYEVSFFEALFGGPPPAGASSRLWGALDGIELALSRMDRQRVGVVLIGFAGEEGGLQEASWLESALTNDYSAIDAGTERMRARDADGLSCHACAAKFAISQLAPERSQGRCSVLVVLADAEPSLPREFEYVDANRREFTRALESSGISHRALVILGVDDRLTIRRTEALMTAVDVKMHRAYGAQDVAAAIVASVDSCD